MPLGSGPTPAGGTPLTDGRPAVSPPPPVHPPEPTEPPELHLPEILTGYSGLGGSSGVGFANPERETSDRMPSPLPGTARIDLPPSPSSSSYSR